MDPKYSLHWRSTTISETLKTLYGHISKLFKLRANGRTTKSDTLAADISVKKISLDKQLFSYCPLIHRQTGRQTNNQIKTCWFEHILFSHQRKRDQAWLNCDISPLQDMLAPDISGRKVTAISDTYQALVPHMTSQIIQVSLTQTNNQIKKTDNQMRH